MGFEKKIRKELDRHERLWEGAAILPSVTKFGRQADKRIAKLKAALIAEQDSNHRLSARELELEAGYDNAHERFSIAMTEKAALWERIAELEAELSQLKGKVVPADLFMQKCEDKAELLADNQFLRKTIEEAADAFESAADGNGIDFHAYGLEMRAVLKMESE